MKTSPPSLIGRAVLAVLLTLGFYGLALGIVAGLLYLVYAEFAILGRINIQITLGALAGAGAILWAILPRGERFSPPGILLTEQEQPRLFAEIRQAAKASGQALPAEVYLVAAVNAFVAERSGALGIGKTRFLGIGLPLLQAFSVSQLRGVLAHEFGHYYGGDTAIAPWIFRTRLTIVRTVQGLGNRTLLRVPFVGYAQLFLRITQSISRRQELVADRLSAEVAGKQAVIGGLRRVHGVAPAFDAYMRNEVAPVIETGYRPPLMEGFTRFLAAPAISEAVARAIEKEGKASSPDPYDSHPTLGERIASLGDLPDGNAPVDETSAAGLLEDPPALEEALVAFLAGEQRARALQPVRWEDVGAQVLPQRWEKGLQPFRPYLANLTVNGLFSFVSQPPQELVAGLAGQAGRPLSISPAELRQVSGALAAAALAVALVRRGWQVDTSPGKPVILRQDGQALEIFELGEKLGKGELDEAAWQALCAGADIGGVKI